MGLKVLLKEDTKTPCKLRELQYSGFLFVLFCFFLSPFDIQAPKRAYENVMKMQVQHFHNIFITFPAREHLSGIEQWNLAILLFSNARSKDPTIDF